MKHLPVVLLLVIYNFCCAQSLQVLDSETNEPVPFATILFVENNKTGEGYYADEKGKFKIPDSKVFDEVRFSCIGYASKTIAKDKLADGIVLLKRITYQLDEVIVSAGAQSSEVGQKVMKGRINTAASLGAQVVLFIENPDKNEKKIKSFVFKSSTPKNYKTAFRIHFYKKDTVSGGPGEEMPHRDIVQYINPGKGIRQVEVDVAPYGILLPAEGLYAGIEWLSSINAEGKVLGRNDYEGWYSTVIEYNCGKGTPQTYYKQELEATEWQAVEKCNATFWLKVLKN